MQNTGRLGASAFGHPLDKLGARLSDSAVRADPRGAAFAIFGLLSADSGSATAKAREAARSLLNATTSDGAWGPDGNADSSSTAVVLQALAASGVANRDAPQVRSGFDYLRAAQINDGALAESTRLDKASAAGSVAATAYAIQAVAAFGEPMIRTATGKTLKQGLTDYQQRASGGLTSKGGQYSQVPPSVVETAQAFPAFNGVSYRLTPVKSTTGGPDAATERADAERRAAEKTARQRGQAREHGRFGRRRLQRQQRRLGFRQRPEARSEEATSGGGRAGEERTKSGRRDGRASADGRRAADDSRAATEAPANRRRGSHRRRRQSGLRPGAENETRADDFGLHQQTAGDARRRRHCSELLLLLGIALERLRPRPTGARPLPTEAIVAAAAPAAQFVRGAAWLGGRHVRDPQTSRRLVARRRWPLLLALVVGAALIALPAATKMFERAPQGAADGRRLRAVRDRRADRRSFQRNIREVDAYAQEGTDGRAPAIFVPGVGDPRQRQRGAVPARSPQVALFSQRWPAVRRTFEQAAPGTIAASRANYEAVAALPSFTLFPWFFVVPGRAAGGARARRTAARPPPPGDVDPAAARDDRARRRARARPGRLPDVARAPQGGRMVDAFKTLETAPERSRTCRATSARSPSARARSAPSWCRA